MRTLPFHWPHALLFWGVFVWAFVPEFRIVRRARRDQTAADSKSLQVITRGGGLAMLLAFLLAPMATGRMSTGLAPVAFFTGVAALIAGSLLRRHCWRMLGASFTGDVRASADQRVVDSGAYRYLRHPSYTAGILMNTGIGLALGNWLSLAIIVAGSLAVYSYRMAVEERALASVIGEPYRQFMATRKRVIPFIY